MKKLFFAVAAIAAMISVSCVTERPTPVTKDGKVSITVSIPGFGSSTRMAQTPASTMTPAFKTGGTHYVYVLDGEAVIYSEALTTGGKITLKGIGGVAESFPKGAEVYVLANIPADIASPDKLGSMTDITNAVSAISASAGGANTDYEHPAMGNVTGAAAKIGEANASNVASVSVPISPLYARVEIKGIKGSEWISAFTLANVYIDNYYSSFSMIGKGSVLNNAGTSTSILSKQFGDAVTGGNWTAPSATPVTAGGSNVWAYHVGPGTLVKVIFELSSYSAYPAQVSDATKPNTAGAVTTKSATTYVTIGGYSQAITSFERGKIYTISPVTFSKTGQANDEPNSNLVSIEADITVTNWEPVGLDGVIVED